MKINAILASLAVAYFGLASAYPYQLSTCVEHVIDCEAHHKVVASDTCGKLATAYNITVSYLIEINPGISCKPLPVGKNICHKAKITTTKAHTCTTTKASKTKTTTTPTTTPTGIVKCSLHHTVVATDGPTWCVTIAKNANISIHTFFSLNPTIDNPKCDNLALGEKVCIKGTVTIPTTTTSHKKTTTTTSSSTSTPTGDKIAVVKDIDDFCFFLPPPGSNKNIADHENDAVAFCTRKNALSPKALIFPDGFFKYKYYLAGKKAGSYVQITGQINDTKYGLKSSDGGGQYDSEGSPPGAICAGYAHFVNLIEPDVHRFCIRCCAVRSDCNFGHSKYGCPTVVPGNYGPGEEAQAPNNNITIF